MKILKARRRTDTDIRVEIGKLLMHLAGTGAWTRKTKLSTAEITLMAMYVRDPGVGERVDG